MARLARQTLLLIPIRHSSSSPPQSLTITTILNDPSPPPPPATSIKPEEIEEINRLIPILCKSGHPQQATSLIDVSLLAGAPLKSIDLPSLLRHTCSSKELDMGLSMNLLTALLHNPISSSSSSSSSSCGVTVIGAVSMMIVEMYLENGRPRFALKVFEWMRKRCTSSGIEPGLWGKLVKELCRHGLLLDALKVVREMVEMGVFDENDDVRGCVCRRLMYEARVREAIEMDEALKTVGKDVGAALGVIDLIIMNWSD